MVAFYVLLKFFNHAGLNLMNFIARQIIIYSAE